MKNKQKSAVIVDFYPEIKITQGDISRGSV